MYNFEVEEFHTYYVGESSILVHSAKYPDGSEASSKQIFDEALERLNKSGTRPGKTERYIVDGHHTTVASTILGKG